MLNVDVIKSRYRLVISIRDQGRYPIGIPPIIIVAYWLFALYDNIMFRGRLVSLFAATYRLPMRREKSVNCAPFLFGDGKLRTRSRHFSSDLYRLGDGRARPRIPNE